MIIFFWVCLLIIAYTFVGYGMLLYILVRIKRLFTKPMKFSPGIALPSVTLLVAAWNEEDIILDKIKNTLQLDYPEELLEIIFITDGSTDRTPDLIAPYHRIMLMHNGDRHGKMAAIKRALTQSNGEIIVFSDANTFLNKEALKELVKHYQNAQVGAVAGEKRILVEQRADASSAGEGFYWRYESALKKWDYELYSNVGAAGELFSIRAILYESVPSDTIIDDHMIAMRIAEKGYLIAYEPKAYASETASENTAEELKRKIRIAAGGLQSVFRLKIAINPFYYPVLTFQYVSHRVLRWTVTPFLLMLAVLFNLVIVLQDGGFSYQMLLVAQLGFYGFAILGFFMEQRNIRIKALFIPYYFCMMNYAVAAGIFRYFNQNQSAAWERSKRKTSLIQD